MKYNSIKKSQRQFPKDL